jgi:hypothetical protein
MVWLSALIVSGAGETDWLSGVALLSLLAKRVLSLV